jgi:tetratricopeptide (TPR) repeat protein
MAKDARAYDLFLQARQLFDRGQVSDPTIMANLEEALRLDSAFMAAAALLSTTHSRLHGSFNQAAATRAHHAAEAKRWADTAARLMPGGAGDGPLAVYFGRIEQDFVRSLSYAENLIRALPNEATGYDFAAMALGKVGRYSEAVALCEKALTLDPLNPLYWQNQVSALTRLRRGPQALEALARLQNLLPPERTKWITDSTHYRLTGTTPTDGTADTTITTQLWRMRKFDELLIRLERSLQRQLTDEMRFIYLEQKSHTHLRLGQLDRARLAAEEALKLASTPALDTDQAPDEQGMRRARALALLGRAEEALAAGRRSLEAAWSPNQTVLRWDREADLAVVFATLKRPRECAELLAKLLRLPSDVTVPMLKVDPIWDSVREDAAFKALLADPKNSAPL